MGIEKDAAPVALGVHNYSKEDKYVKPTDPQILERLEWFMDQKLGIMMHWAPYSQMGIVESWAMSDEDCKWSRKDVDWIFNPAEFKKEYWALNKTFNPVRFLPEAWAKLAVETGFKYLTFTTKHHDGFCMYDSKYSNYKVTAPDCPFSKHKYADVCKVLFDAFRKQGLGIAAYFSKADWNEKSYWQHDRNSRRGPTYDPKDDPKLWERFVSYTHGQILELVENYGRLDVLWFDAGWVCAAEGQDIKIEELIAKARKIQPWVLSADRTVGGTCEDFVTPEQTVPTEPMTIPFESNVTMGTSFSFKYDDEYKSARQLIHLLVDVVCKGGNLSLNVGPMPDGRLPKPAIERMRAIGEWIGARGEAIYGTRPQAPYRAGKFGFTQKGGKKYAIYLRDSDCAIAVMPFDEKIVKINELTTGREVRFERAENGYALTLPDGDPYADVFVIE